MNISHLEKLFFDFNIIRYNIVKILDYNILPIWMVLCPDYLKHINNYISYVNIIVYMQWRSHDYEIGGGGYV